MTDLRFALRRLRRNPGFAAVAVLTLALGIATNTTIFSVVQGVLLKPLPYPEPDRLVFAWNTYPRMSLDKAGVAIPDYLDRRAAVPTFAESTLFADASFSFADGTTPERLRGLRVTPSFFATYGIAPKLGTGFTDAEAEPGNDRAVVLTHALWKAKFGGDPRIVGREIRLNGESWRVKGVMPERFLAPGRDAVLFVPFAFTPKQRSDDERGQEYSTMVARLAPGATMAQAQAQLDAIQIRNAERLPQAREFWRKSAFGGKVISYLEETVGTVRPLLLMLQGATVLVLLIACANVANLLLIRAGARAREIAVRTAIGAGRSEIARLLLAESLSISLAAGVVGVALGWVGVRLLGSLGISELPRAHEIAVDGGVVAFSLLLSTVTGLFFGLAPLFALFRGSLAQTMRDGAHASAGRATGRLRGGLIIVEVALAFALLTGAALLYRSFANVQKVDLGLRVENVLTAQLALPASRYPDDPKVADFYARLMERVRALPGVINAGVVDNLPLSGMTGQSSYNIAGATLAPGEADPHAINLSIDSGYFATAGVKLLRGRGILDSDDEKAPKVVVIDQFLADKYFKNTDPIGRALYFDTANPTRTWEIVGVAANVHAASPAEPVAKETIYFSQRQNPTRTMGLVVKTPLDPQSLVNSVRAAVQAIDPEQPIFDVRTLDQRLAKTLQTMRASMVLVVAFGVGALLLATVGLYGVLAYSVSQRSREIGIRLAVGAQMGDVAKMIVAQGVRLAGVGVGLGLMIALGLGGTIRRLLFGVTAFQPTVWLTIGVVLGVAAIVASLVPALRAARVNPMLTLRGD